MAQLIEPPGGEGPVNEPEWWVVDRLRRELPEDYLLIPNLLVAQAGGQRFEYDLVVVAPHAVYVVEVKGWQGRIRGDRFEWSLNSWRRRNPMLVTERKAKVLKSLLVNHAQALGRVWVEAVVVLAAEQVTLELTGEAARMVVKLPELAGLLQDPGAVGQQPEAIAGLGRKVCEAILHRTGPRERTMRFREYEVLETLEQGEEESLYRARRVDLPGAPEVRLRVVTLSPYLLGEERRRERMARLRREVEALWRMGAHPNVVAAREVFEDEDGRMVVVLDPDDSRSLRQRLADGTPLTVEQRLGILADVCRGLAHAHEHGVVHRLVTPAHVLLGPDGQARLADFELAKLVSEGTATVWQLDAVDLPDRSYLAPELRNPALGQAGPATDLYGLGRLAWELFDSGTAGGAEPTPATPPPTAMPAGLAELVRGLLQTHPAGRPADASEVLATIERLRGSGEERRVTPPKPEYEVGDLINNDFEVREILGSGGFRFVYRVYRAVDDCEFALKVYNAGGFEEARREVTILRSIGPHPNIEEIVWADRTSQGQWYLLTKLVEGEPLGEYARGGKRLSVDEVRRVGDQLLAALEAIHPDQRRIAELETAGRGRTLTQAEYDELRDLKARGIVHRDVKPHNLMRATDGVVLIDFNIASLAGAPAATQSGTPRYQAPDATGFPEWNPSVDLFAAGVTLYELLCGEHPYEGAVPTAALRPRDPRIFRRELSGEVAAFLLKACAPHADQRYASATDMRDAWAAIESFVVPTDRQRPSDIAPRLADLLDAAPPNVNPMVTELLGLCSQARRSNRETRGLSDLAESTYVETRLDRDLADAVLAGRHRLVVVTGNAGDGKTAFIQKTETRAKQLGGTVEKEGPDGRVMRLPHDGRLLRTLYDGSEDEQGASQRTSDEVLSEFLGPFGADGRDDGAIRVAAINEGRLRDFIGMHADRFSRLLDLLGELDEPGRTRRDELLLVNLNLRSVTAGGADSIFSQQIRVIVEGPFWKPCQGCDFRTRCPIKHNVDTFADPDSGAEVTERLRRLADLVRLRRRRHLTMRDVRSLISFALFRDRDCHEIAELLAGPDPMAVVDLVYFQAAGGLGIPPGTALEQNAALLAEADVAAVANPADDRALATRKDIARLSFSRRESDFFHQRIAEVYEQAGRGYEADREGVLRAHAALRRLAYFERRDERWLEMLPYKQLPEMERALAPEGGPDRTALRDRLVQALSAAQGMGNPLDHQVALWLATGDVGDGSDGLRGFRRFPADDFELRIARAAAPYMEAEPDQLELVCQPGPADTVLPVDLDVLELLDRLREGYMPSVDERRGLLVHIELFFNRLRVLANRELLLVADERMYRIAAQPGGIIELSEVQS